MYFSYTIPYVLFVCFSLGVFLLSSTTSKFPVLNTTRLELRYFYLLSVIVFLGCRGLVGADWISYKKAFDNAPVLFAEKEKINYFLNHSLFEKGYCYFTIIIKTISHNYLLLQFIALFIDIIILHYFFMEYCNKYYFLAWALYFIFSGFMFEIIILRNAKSILLFCLSIKYAYERKIFKYYALNLLALSFHASAIVYLPFYFILRIKRHKTIEILFFIIGNAMFLFHIAWLKTFLNLIPLPGRIGAITSWYLEQKNTSKAFGLSIGYFERFFTFILFYKYLDVMIHKDDRVKIFWFLYLVYLAFYLYCSEVFIVIERMPNLFVCSYWILYVKLYDELKVSQKKIFMLCLLFYGVLKTVSLMNYNWAFYENFLLVDNGLIRGKEYL